MSDRGLLSASSAIALSRGQASEDLTDDSLWDAAAVTKERERLQKVWEAHLSEIRGTMTTLTGPSYKMAVLLDLLHKYPERPITGTDYVASFGTHDAFPGFKPRTGEPFSPLTGCHKTEQSHAEQLTDTSSLNLFFDDELFAAAVLGGNFFRVAGLSTQFAPPAICRSDSVDTSIASALPTPPTMVSAAVLRGEGGVDAASTTAAAPNVAASAAAGGWSGVLGLVAVGAAVVAFAAASGTTRLGWKGLAMAEEAGHSTVYEEWPRAVE